ncbi:hypothetical protein [Agrococcus casei]|uniref:hypothetical protein n=1 Tax=Agrococcus casei TaxID=343512 RepID=UPI003F8F6C23
MNYDDYTIDDMKARYREAADTYNEAAGNYATAARRLRYAQVGYLVGLTFWIIGAAMYLIPRWL